MASGSLSQDSPALYGQLRRLLNAEELQSLLIAYQQSYSDGGTEESPTIREPGASFNPRPARICQILLKEAGVTDPQVLRQAMQSAKEFSTIGQPQLNSQTDYQNLLIKYAVILDYVRHLHMTNVSIQERQEYLEKIQKWQTQLPEQATHPRLRLLLQCAIERHSENLHSLAT